MASNDEAVTAASVAPEPEQPPERPEDQTLLGDLADCCLALRVEPADVAMGPYLEAAARLRDMLVGMGTAVNLALGDIDKNLSFVSERFKAEREARATLRSFLQAELALGVHKAGAGSACRLKDPSGACKLQWLLRGQEFFLMMVQRMFDGDSSAASTAYAHTLQQYHGWVTSAAVKTSLFAMPGRESICRMRYLCPPLAASNDEARLAAAITRDARRATAMMLPAVQQMISICREVGLWENHKV